MNAQVNRKAGVSARTPSAACAETATSMRTPSAACAETATSMRTPSAACAESATTAHSQKVVASAHLQKAAASAHSHNAAGSGSTDATGKAAALKALKSGQIAIIPTDTVYGLALVVRPETTPEQLFLIKRRPIEKNIPCLLASRQDIFKYGSKLEPYVELLIERFWPGALTLVVQAGAALSRAFLAADGSVALRVPAHAGLTALIDELNSPLSVTSANISGRAAVSRASALDPELTCQVAAVWSDDAAMSGAALASSIIDCRGKKPIMLREGSLSAEILLDLV